MSHFYDGAHGLRFVVERGKQNQNAKRGWASVVEEL